MRYGDLNEILSAYATHLGESRGYAEGTRKAYLGAARELAELIERAPETLLLASGAGISTVDKRALEIHINRLRDTRGWRPATLAAHLRALRAFFGWLHSSGRIAGDPTHGLRVAVGRRDAELPAGDEAGIRALFQVPGPGLAGARLGLLLELIYGGGMRPVHAYGVLALRCDAEHGKLHALTAKGERELPLSAEGLARAEAYLSSRREVVERKNQVSAGTSSGILDDAPFWIGARGRGLGAASLGKQVRAAMQRAGLSGGPADLRRLAARHFRERGADLRSVQRFLGARRLGGLQRFSSAEFRGVTETLRKLHPRRDRE